MPRQQARVRIGGGQGQRQGQGQGLISHYFASRICVVCETAVIHNPRAQALSITFEFGPNFSISVYALNWLWFVLDLV